MTVVRSCEDPLMLRDSICYQVGLAVHILPQYNRVFLVKAVDSRTKVSPL